jgi:hypothetical protein
VRRQVKVKVKVEVQGEVEAGNVGGTCPTFKDARLERVESDGKSAT